MKVPFHKLVGKIAKEDIMIFPFYHYGAQYAQNGKKPARVTIQIPTELTAGMDMRYEREWVFRVVAIRRTEFERAFNLLEKEARKE